MRCADTQDRDAYESLQLLVQKRPQSNQGANEARKRHLTQHWSELQSSLEKLSQFAATLEVSDDGELRDVVEDYQEWRSNLDEVSESHFQDINQMLLRLKELLLVEKQQFVKQEEELMRGLGLQKALVAKASRLTMEDFAEDSQDSQLEPDESNSGDEGVQQPQHHETLEKMQQKRRLNLELIDKESELKRLRLFGAPAAQMWDQFLLTVAGRKWNWLLSRFKSSSLC